MLTYSARAEPPRPAQGVFVTNNYALTFRAPPGLTYCRRPGDRVGDDGGIVLSLVPPTDCDRPGFPAVEGDVLLGKAPRIAVFYNHDVSDIPEPPCRRIVGHVRLLGRVRPLCRTVHDGATFLEVSTPYFAGGPNKASVALVTTPARLRRDLQMLSVVAAAVRTCVVTEQDAEHRTQTMGSGRPCPEKGDFY